MSNEFQHMMDFLKTYGKLRFGDLQLLQKKVHKFFLDGPEHLMVVADFDYTLTRSKTDSGKKCPITYDVFEEEAKRTSAEEARQFAELCRKYYPIELDPKIPVEEKIPHMVQWWEGSNRLILSKKYSKDYIKDLVARTDILLRSGISVFFKSLKQHNIPLVIFSAGIGDVIEILLKCQLGVVDPNIHIISNMFIYNATDNVCGFSTPLIHTYSKNGSMIEKCQSLKQSLAGRFNVLLMGDSLGDVTMADGYCPDIGELTTLKLGFLNDPCGKNLSNYCDSYDAVLVDDETMKLPVEIVNYICCEDNGQKYADQ